MADSKRRILPSPRGRIPPGKTATNRGAGSAKLGLRTLARQCAVIDWGQQDGRIIQSARIDGRINWWSDSQARRGEARRDRIVERLGALNQAARSQCSAGKGAAADPSAAGSWGHRAGPDRSSETVAARGSVDRDRSSRVARRGLVSRPGSMIVREGSRPGSMRPGSMSAVGASACAPLVASNSPKQATACERAEQIGILIRRRSVYWTYAPSDLLAKYRNNFIPRRCEGSADGKAGITRSVQPTRFDPTLGKPRVVWEASLCRLAKRNEVFARSRFAAGSVSYGRVIRKPVGAISPW